MDEFSYRHIINHGAKKAIDIVPLSNNENYDGSKTQMVLKKLFSEKGELEYHLKQTEVAIELILTELKNAI